MSLVITAAEVFSALDAERPTCSLARIGGGAYRVTFSDKRLEEFPSYDEAIVAIDTHIAEREADPDAAVKKLQARVAVLEAKLREVGVDVEAVAEPVVKG